MAMNAPRRNGGGLYQPLADINVTPLVDVMLVLLIVFMVTAPMLATGVKVNLPQAKKSAHPLKPTDPVTVTVSKEGKLFVNAEETPSALLVDTVRAKLANAPDAPIRLRGDKDAAYGEVISVLDLLSSQGLTRIALMSDARKSKEPAAEATAK